jgi:hypothetical protein
MKRLVIGFALASGCAAAPDDGVASESSSSSGAPVEDGDDGDDAPEDDGGSSDDDAPAESSGDGTSVGSTGGDSSEDGSDGGTDTGGHGSEDGGGASVECAALMECCDQLGADIYVGCVTVVDLEMPALCDSTLATYHQEGYCTGETFCEDLGDCCGELPPGPGWQDTCTYYADLGNQPQCAMLIGDYQLSGYCF